MKRRLSSGKALKTGRLLLNAIETSDGSDEEKEAQKEEEIVPQTQKPPTTTTATTIPTATSTQSTISSTQQQKRKPLSNEQLSEMYANVIKLCAQNRVTPQNAWSLKLIDHIDAVIGGEDETDEQTSKKQQQQPQKQAQLSQLQQQQQKQRKNNNNNSNQEEEGTNFQLASCTLDASALIYSARVDSVHKTAYEVLGGLSHAAQGASNSSLNEDENEEENRDKTDENEQNDEEFDENGTKKQPSDENQANQTSATNENKPPKQRKSTTSSADTLDTPENLCGKRVDSTADDDPLFRKVSSFMNVGGCRGLLMSNLSSIHGSEISLEPTTISDANEIITEHFISPSSDEIDRSAIIGLFGNKEISDLVICPMVRDYNFRIKSIKTETLKKQEASSSTANEYETISSNAVIDLNVLQPPLPSISTEVADEMNGNDNQQLGIPMTFDAGEDIDDGGGGGDGGDDDDNNNNNSKRTTNNPIPAMELTRNEEDNQQQQQRNEFSFFDPKLMKNWAGPDHWKFPTNTKKKQTTTNKSNTNASASANNATKEESKDGNDESDDEGEKGRAKKRQKRKEETLIDFSAPVKIDRKLFEPPTKASTTLSDAALKKHTSSATTLPPDCHYDVSMLSRLFLNPNWRFTEKRAKTPISLTHQTNNSNNNQKPTVIFTDSQSAASQEWYEYHNPITTGNENEDEDNENGDAAGDVDFGTTIIPQQEENQINSTTVNPNPNPNPNLHLAPVLNSLVKQPMQVQMNSIGYAHAIKRMDVAAVKTALWRAFTRVEINQQSQNAEEEEEVKQQQQQQQQQMKKKSFRKLLEALPSLLPQNIIQELSVAFCFVCLLHLCNDKGLRLEGGGTEELCVILPIK